jgi:hypothetical protein
MMQERQGHVSRSSSCVPVLFHIFAEFASGDGHSDSNLHCCGFCPDIVDGSSAMSGDRQSSHRRQTDAHVSLFGSRLPRNEKVL